MKRLPNYFNMNITNRKVIGIVSLLCMLSGVSAFSNSPKTNLRPSKSYWLANPPCSAGQTGGKVWQDFNNNGIMDTNETSVIEGVIVKAYTDNGVLLASDTTDAAGTYNLGTLSVVPSASSKVRLEFSNFPLGMMPAKGGADNATDAQFIDAADCSIDFGLIYYYNYCQANPRLVTNCYVNGATTGTGAADVLVGWPYDASGSGSNVYVSTKSQTGSTWGLAYSRTTNTLYSATFLKRHVDIGPSGMGAIYKTGNADAASGFTNALFFDVASVAGAVVGTEPTTRGLGNPTAPSNDANAFSQVGKIGLGDLDISLDNKNLYVVSLADKKLYNIVIDADGNPATAPNAATDVTSFAIPDPGCVGGNWRPFALKVAPEGLYVGGICDGLTSGLVSDLSATVYLFDGATFTSKLSVPLDYQRENQSTAANCNWTTWLPWRDTWFPTCSGTGDPTVVYPQPILSDIELTDDGKTMILGFIDRAGHQAGWRNYGTTGTTVYRNFAAGDILKATQNASGTFVIEPLSTTVAQEFYFEDEFGGHTEISAGGLIQIPGQLDVVGTVFDPNSVFSGGVRKYSNIAGTAPTTTAYKVFQSTDTGTQATFGKALGVGDLEAMCDRLPIQLGNRVWYDANKNGIYDPNEKGLAGIEVSLFSKTGSLISTVNTNAAGNYLFTENNALSLTPGDSAYIVIGKTAQFNTTTSKLTTAGMELQLTATNNVANNGNDQNDNDFSILGGSVPVSLAGYPILPIQIPADGGSIHTLDAGLFGCVLPVFTATQTPHTCFGPTPKNDATITVTSTGDKYGLSATADYATATSFTGSFTVTGLAAGSVNLIRIFNNDATCYKDTTITVPTNVCLAPTCNTATGIGGTVWDDKDNDGIKDATETGGFVGVKVYAYDCNGTKIDSAMTDMNGDYTFTNITTTDTVRIEFDRSTFPSYAKATANGVDGQTDVQFVKAPNCTVDLGMVIPTDYCQTDPQLVTSCFVNGLQNSTSDAIVGIDYSTAHASVQHLADVSQVGSVWGQAFQPQTQLLYSAAMLRRHAGFGPGKDGVMNTQDDISTIYATRVSGTTYDVTEPLAIDLASFGVDVGVNPRVASTPPSDLAGPTAPNHDYGVFENVAKRGIGGVVVSEDGSTLYAVNLNSANPELVALNITDPANVSLISKTPITNPGCPAGDSFAPWGVNMHLGKPYVGVVCTADVTATASNLRAYIMKLDGGSFVNVDLDASSANDYIKLDYDRGCRSNNGTTCFPAEWTPWFNTWPTGTVAELQQYKLSPTPILSDFAFHADGSISIGLMDRTPHQGGMANYSPDPASTSTYSTTGAGDMLKVCSVNGLLYPEGNALCVQPNTNASDRANGATNALLPSVAPDGVGTPKEFYADDVTLTAGGYHGETFFGGIALHPTLQTVATTTMDPTNIFNSGGYKWYNTTTGDPSDTYLLYSSGTSLNGTYGKANGLGDATLLCDPLPIEIGNRLWLDTDRDGVQDPCAEPGVPNVVVSLYTADGTKVGQTTTSASGEYYFNKTNVVDTVGLTKPNFVGPQPNTQYYIVFGKEDGTYSTTKEVFTLSGKEYELTTLNATASSGNDQNDSDASLAAAIAPAALQMYPSILVTTPLVGSNHTFDVGIVPPLPFGSIGNYVWKDTNNNGQQDASEPAAANIVIELYKNGVFFAKDTTDASGLYLFKMLDSASYKIKVDTASIPDTCSISLKPNAATITDELDSDVSPSTFFSQEVIIDPTNPTGGAMKDNLTLDVALRLRPIPVIQDPCQCFRVVYDIPEKKELYETLKVVSQPGESWVVVAQTGALTADSTTPKVPFPVGTVLVETATSNYTAKYTIEDNVPYTITVTNGTDTLTYGATCVNKYPSVNVTTLPVSVCVESDPIPLSAIATPAIPGITFFTLVPSTGAVQTITSFDPGLYTAEDTVAVYVNIPGTATSPCPAIVRQNIIVSLLNCPRGSIGDLVWKDADKDGAQDASEVGVANIQVELYRNGVLYAKDTTDAAGKYLFTQLDSATYKVRLITASFPAGCEVSAKPNAAGVPDSLDTDFTNVGGFIESGDILIDPSNPTGAAVQNNTTIDAGLQFITGSLGNFVWKDTDNDGTQDASEVGVANVIIQLYKDGALFATDTTDAAGKYLFTQLDSATYKVRVLTASLPAACEISAKPNAAAVSDTLDSDVSLVAGFYESQSVIIDGTPVVGTSLKDDMSLDVGLVAKTGSIGDLVWKDADKDGRQDASELGVANVQVELYRNGVLYAKDTTDAAGKYSFTQLDSATYKVRLITASFPAGCEVSEKPNSAGVPDSLDTDFTNVGGFIESGDILIDPSNPTGAAVQNNTTIDAGLQFITGSLGNYVWKDTDNDGIQDATETGVSNVYLELYSGTTLVAKDTTDAAGKYLFSNLAAGTYSVKIVGSSIPAGCVISTMQDLGTVDSLDSDFSPTTLSSGTYTITPTDPLQKDITTVDAALYSPLGSIGNLVWKDTNNNGLQDAGELGSPNVIVELYKGTSLVAKDTTDASGAYLFGNLTAGDYTVKVVSTSLPVGCAFSALPNSGTDESKDSDIDPATGSTGVISIDPTDPTKKDISTVDVGLYTPVGSIGDLVWKDTDNDGIQDATETGVANVTVELYKGTTLVAKDTTDAAGKYLFTNLLAGDYSVKLVATTLPSGCSLSTVQDAGTNDAIDNDFDDATASTSPITILPTDPTKKDILTVDAALTNQLGSIGDLVWKDTDNDGIQDATEVGVSNVYVELYNGTTLVAKDTTDGAGKYLFTNLPSGTYTVKLVGVSIPAGCSVSTQKDLGTDEALDSDFSATTLESGPVVVDVTDPTKQNITTVDAALFSPLGSLGNFVWKDTDNDGIQDASEPGVNNVIVELYKGTTLVGKDTTDASGHFLFGNLVAGTYSIKIVSSSLPAGCNLSSLPNTGTDDTKDSDVDPTTGTSGTYTIDPTDPTKKDITTVGAALVSPLGSLGDLVWKDTDNDGVQDAGEPGVEGVIIELYSGTTLIGKDTTDASGKYLFTNLPSGDYSIKVVTTSIPVGSSLSSLPNTGTDDTKDSDVNPTTGASGVYTIDTTDPTKKDILTVDAAIVNPLGSLGDLVWKDTDNDGVQDAGEIGVGGVEIELYKNGILQATQTTDANGKYLFESLEAGEYSVKVLSTSLPAGCTLSSMSNAGIDDTKDSDIDPVSGTSPVYLIDPSDPSKTDILTVDAALNSPLGSLGDLVWKDTNNNGTQDAGEPGVSGVTVELYRNGVLSTSVVTDVNGNYVFYNLDAATYTVKILDNTLPAGCVLSDLPNTGTDDAKDSDIDPSTGMSGPIAIDPSNPATKDIRTVDAALVSPLGSLGNLVWKDTDNDGLQDIGEAGVGGVVVELYMGTTLMGNTTTDENGAYLFSNLSSGNYTIKVSNIPVGCVLSVNQNAGANEATDSDVNPISGISDVFVINTTDPLLKDIRNVDAALYSPLGSIGDLVWKDTNNNGLQDLGEPGVSGVTLELYKAGVLVANTTTDADGYYVFSALPAGDYTVKLVSSSLPAGCTITSKMDISGNDSQDSDFNPSTGLSGVYTIDPADPLNKDIRTVDGALYSPLGTLGDLIWKDTNNNGLQESTEAGVAGVKVSLFLNGVLSTSTITDVNGSYLFSNLVAGAYTVKIDTTTLPAGCELSILPNAGLDDTKDSDFNPITGESVVYNVDPTNPLTKDISTVDGALYSPLGSLGDFVWKDTDNDGLQDVGEAGVPGVKIELYSGTTLLKTTTTDALGQYIFTDLPAGTYAIKVAASTLPAGCSLSTLPNTGNNDALDTDINPTTAMSGTYQILPSDPALKDIMTVDVALVSAKGSIGDQVWKDTDNDGIQDAGEAGVAGVTMQLFNGTTLVNTAVTSATGTYLFSNLDAGTYTVKILTSSLPAGCSLSTLPNAGTNEALDSDFGPTTGTSDPIMVDPSDPTKKDILTVDAALVSPLGSIGDYVWKDTDNDGLQDATETGVAGVTVELYKAGTLVSTDITDASGLYLFSNLPAGDYQVKIVTASLPAGCTLSTKVDAGTNDALDTDFNPTTGLSGVYSIVPSDPTKKDILTVDAGLYSALGSIGDLVWKDTDNDGIQDAGELGVANVTVELYNGTTLIKKDTTDANGSYLFSNLPAGSYTVKLATATLPAGCSISTLPDTGTNEALDSDFNPSTASTQPILIDPADPTKKDVSTVDAALVSSLGSIGDLVWKDTNNNGIQDAGETGAAGVSVQLLKNGVLTAVATTDASGAYQFTNLAAGDYQIKIVASTLPAGCSISTKVDQGTDETKDSDINPSTGTSGIISVDPADPAKKVITNVDAALYTPVGTLGNFVWKDADNDGQQDAGELGVADVILELYKGTTLVAKDTTDASGKYLFTNLPLDEYYVQIVVASLPADCNISSQKDIGNNDLIDSDFDPTTGKSGFYTVVPLDPSTTNVLTVDAALTVPKGSIGDYVWKDANNNGIQDGAEVGVAGVKVTLLNDGSPVANTITDASGKYAFVGLTAGNYQIKIDATTLPATCELSTKKDVGTDDTKDSDIDPATGTSGVITLNPADPAKRNITNVDAAVKPNGVTLGYYVWKDADQDGQQDANELPVNGMRVILWSASATGTPLAKLDSTVTVGGLYEFTNLPKGDYMVQFVSSTAPVDCDGFTKSNTGSEVSDSDADANGFSPVVSVDPKVSTIVTSIDAGLKPKDPSCIPVCLPVSIKKTR